MLGPARHGSMFGMGQGSGLSTISSGLGMGASNAMDALKRQAGVFRVLDAFFIIACI